MQARLVWDQRGPQGGRRGSIARSQGCLFAAAGRRWPTDPPSTERDLKVQEVEGPLRPYSKEAMGKKLLEEMPEGFRIIRHRILSICYDTTDAYAKWAGGLYERLYKSFQGFWREKKFALEEPRFPLVALIFQTKASYLRYAQPEIGKSAESMFGYYNVMSNRVVSFDLTVLRGRSGWNQVKQGALVQRILAQPDAERNVATIVHESVHQLSYNSGLQVRMADNPIWVSEGLAMFFETPDLSSTNGWGSIGKVNQTTW